MTLTFRDVKGARLTSPEFDGNTRDLDGRISALEASPSTPEFVFEVVGDQFYVTVDGTTGSQGPFDLPTVEWNFREDGWLPSTAYVVNDVFAVNYVVYRTIFAHTSELTFDPGANDGFGNDYYEVLLDLGLAALSGVSQFQTTSDDEITAGLSYANKFTECEADFTVVTIPTNASVAHVLNTEIHFVQTIEGEISVVPQDGTVTIDYPDSICRLATDIPGATITLKKLATNRWRAWGLLAFETTV